MSALLDVALVVLLLAYLLYGYHRGVIRSLGALIGIALGAVVAALLSPVVPMIVPDSTGRVVATVVVSCLLILIGHAIGAGIGALLGRRILRSPLGIIDRVLGAAVNVAVAAIVISVVAASVAALGVPFLAQPIAASAVLRVIGAATPPPLATALAQLRTTVLQTDLPLLGREAGAPTTSPNVPKIDTGTAVLTAAARSVVKVTGTAYACGQDQLGSGFVIAHDRVITNAHVIAGVTDPVILTPDGTSLVGTTVYFDRTSDLAVISVPGLTAKPLPVDLSVSAGDVGVIDGYPYGGPFRSGAAGVLQVAQTRVTDVGGSGYSDRSVATLAADVEQGNSGGPLLGRSGAVLGIVFAKSDSTSDVGFAMTSKQFSGVLADAPSLTTEVASGACTKG